jgi:transketolase
MRSAFVNTLSELMKQDHKIMVLTADMGFSVFEDMQNDYPERFINTGVTEQSSIGIASGLAMSGYQVFFYAQAVFASMRCYEEFRLDIAYNNLDVKVIGTASGFTLNQLGVSHFALEDIGLVRMMPNVTIFTPGDAFEAVWATQKAHEIKSPVYLRITRNNEITHKAKIELPIGNSIKLCDGKDASLLVSGSMLSTAMKVARDISALGYSISIISFPSIRPLDVETIKTEISRTGNIFTLEEHFITGGLGTSVAEVIAEGNYLTRFKRFGIENKYPNITGSVEYLKETFGLSISYIRDEIINSIIK